MALIKRNTAYSLNDIVNTKFGTKLKCTTAGTTDADPLILDGTSPITDGTVVWEVQEQGGSGQGLVDYEANKNYSVGDIVIYGDKIYKCITAYTSTSTFDTSKWEEISGGGISNWQASTSYSIGDIVIYNNKLYKCLTANSDVKFTNINWQKLGDSDFTGATSSTNGNSGLVPTPITSDISKFLCGDGTWKFAGVSGAYVNRDVLFSGNVTIADNAIINLTKSYTNYDYLLIEKVGNGYFCIAMDIDGVESRNILFPCSNNLIDYAIFSALSTTQLKMVDVVNNTGNSKIFRITGIKFLPNPNNYSTTEQEIGIWIDGKKLYQKTYSLTSPYISDGKVELAELPIGVNAENVVAIDVVIASNYGVFIPQWIGKTEDGYCVFIRPNRKIVCEVDRENKENKPLFVTIKYTKT